MVRNTDIEIQFSSLVLLDLLNYMPNQKRVNKGRVYWGRNPPPSLNTGKNKVIFSETRPFFSTFSKKCISTIENPQKPE